MKKIFLLLLLSFQLGYAQIENWKIVPPLDPVTTLSGNYAELRRNHFHGGLDFRTGGVEGMAMYAIDEGYVSKIHISPRGYGKLVYIEHPNGYTSLYAHLSGFVPKLDSIVTAKQYEKKTFEIIIDFSPYEYPVSKGEKFAYSGNSGSSGGPHLHFEVRKNDQTLVNPLQLNDYFEITDKRSPRIQGVKVYGMGTKGTVNNAKEKKMKVVTKNKTRSLQGASDLTAWGEIGFAVSAKDYMTGTSFSYTPRVLKLYVDSQLVSNIEINNINYFAGRAFNSFIDYAEWIKTKEFYMKSFRDPNSPLQVYGDTEYQGVYVIDEEREYPVRYEVYDDFGLKDVISFTIEGKRMLLPEQPDISQEYISYKSASVFVKDDFLMSFPTNALYTDIFVDYQETPSSKFYSPIYKVGDKKIPLHLLCTVSLKVLKDSIPDKEKYFIAKLNDNNIITGSLGGVYVDGFITGTTNEFGKFAVASDTGNPKITALNTTNLQQRPYLKFRIFDGLSGIATYNGYIDDEWVLFEYDAKTNAISCNLNKTQTQRNKNHQFKLVVTDNCGNSAIYEKTIFW
jgi:hypothetical protein